MQVIDFAGPSTGGGALLCKEMRHRSRPRRWAGRALDVSASWKPGRVAQARTPRVQSNRGLVADCSRALANGSRCLVRPPGSWTLVRNHDTKCAKGRRQRVRPLFGALPRVSLSSEIRAADIGLTQRATKNAPVATTFVEEGGRSSRGRAGALPAASGHRVTRAAQSGWAWGRADAPDTYFRTARPPRPAWSSR